MHRTFRTYDDRTLPDGLGTFLPPYRHPSQSDSPCGTSDPRIAMALPLADHARVAFLSIGRLYGLVRQLPGTDGLLHRQPLLLHRIFPRALPQES